MRIRYFVLIYSSIFFLQSCAVLEQDKYFGLNQKTKTIRAKETVGDDIAIIKPFAKWVYLGDEKTIEDVKNNSFRANVEISKLNYLRAPIVNFDWYIYIMYHNFFKTGFVAMICDNDYKIIHEEINKLEKIFRDSTVKDIYMSDALYNAVVHCGAEKCIITDFLEYDCYSLPRSSNPHVWTLYHIFFFEIKTRKLIFYENRVEVNHIVKNKHNQNKYPLLKRLLHKIGIPQTY